MHLRPFRRVLVANRGEIAARVIRACHERGLEAVAVYSDADTDGLAVRLADAAVRLGPAASSASYLRGDLVLEAARRSGCDAIHPGYGFLSENAGFAQRVLDAGLVWIGPPPSAIDGMGSKTAARQRMAAAGVPVVPGTLEALTDLDEARRIALDIGFPIMLKAAAGGGGKGMRAVYSAADLEVALESARSEATRSFGDAAVYLEKLVVRPRHIEIQVLADGFGKVVHLFERDCSIQRRHQKVVEEAPSPALNEETRQAMAAAACRAAAAVGYVGAGTCEFLLGADGAFYFLEMNTRLQVEHPITESITGVDLVQAQLRVAAGEPLWFDQQDLQIRGHAVELRIYAEDATANFRPAPGPLFGYREPAGPWVRTDSGVVEGMEVPIHYDPMIAKLVVWGQNRDEALRRARRALQDYHIVGTTTSIPFFLDLFQDPDFVAGHYDTGFITPDRLARLRPPEDGWEDLAVAAAITAWRQEAERSGSAGDRSPPASAWRWAQQWKTLRRMP